MKRRQVPHPTTQTRLLSSMGRGGPADDVRQRRPQGAKPTAPPLPNPIESATNAATNAATKAVSDALGQGIQGAVRSIIGPGQVLLGVVLIAAGLLLATGQMGRIARGAGRAGLFAASRGALR